MAFKLLCIWSIGAKDADHAYGALMLGQNTAVPIAGPTAGLAVRCISIAVKKAP